MKEHHCQFPLYDNLSSCHYVLSPVVDTCVTYSKTTEPSTSSQSCYVHGALLDRIFLGEKAVFNMQSRVPDCIVSYLL